MERAEMASAAGPILLVDSDDDMRAALRSLLEPAGLAVADAGSGEDALALARAVRPRLALVDVFLPALSGYEVCHRLKTELGIPVVLVSRESRETLDQIGAILLEADGCVAKPFAPDELLGRVLRLLQRPEAA
jgi:DNA-binding response OmpR family regulator